MREETAVHSSPPQRVEKFSEEGAITRKQGGGLSDRAMLRVGGAVETQERGGVGGGKPEAFRGLRWRTRSSRAGGQQGRFRGRGEAGARLKRVEGRFDGRKGKATEAVNGVAAVRSHLVP